MPAQWTAEIVGLMHIYRIDKKRLAKQLNMTPEYISMVLHGHRNPADAEKRFRKALEKIIEEKENT